MLWSLHMRLLGGLSLPLHLPSPAQWAPTFSHPNLTVQGLLGPPASLPHCPSGYVLNCQQMELSVLPCPNSSSPLSKPGLYPLPGWAILKFSNRTLCLQTFLSQTQKLVFTHITLLDQKASVMSTSAQATVQAFAVAFKDLHSPLSPELPSQRSPLPSSMPLSPRSHCPRDVPSALRASAPSRLLCPPRPSPGPAGVFCSLPNCSHCCPLSTFLCPREPEARCYVSLCIHFLCPG